MVDSKQLVAAYRQATNALRGRLIAPYQREGVIWLLHREFQSIRRGGFLCDEMGLGKTIQMIATMLGNPPRPTLIIVPKSIVDQWYNEVMNFAPQLRVYIHDGLKRTTDPRVFDDYDVIVTPYTTLVERNKPSGTPTVLHRVQWGRVILDEAHEIRNPKSKTCISAMQLTADIRWVLSGTPVFNRMYDFVTLCAFVGVDKHIVQRDTNGIRKKYVMRRTKDDVAEFNPRLRLPPCDFQNVTITMANDEKELYSTVYEDCKRRITNQKAPPRPPTREGGEEEEEEELVDDVIPQTPNAIEIFECILRVRQIMIHPQLYFDGVGEMRRWSGSTTKIDTLMNLIGTHPTESSLIFSQFKSEMDIICGRLKAMGKVVFRIDGSVSRADRTLEIENFRQNPGCVFVIQIKAGGQGLNLQEATRVYITTPAWNPAVELQAIGRAHRTGQTRQVHIRKLVYNDVEGYPSIDQSIMHLQGHKTKICAEVLNDDRIHTQLPGDARMTVGQVRKIFQV